LVFLVFIVAPQCHGDEPVVYLNAALETAGKAGRIDQGTLVIRNGKIEGVGPKAAVPEGARVIDAKGKTIMPGIIDPFREVTIAAAADAAPRTIAIGGRTITLQT